MYYFKALTEFIAAVLKKKILLLINYQYNISLIFFWLSKR